MRILVNRQLGVGSAVVVGVALAFALVAGVGGRAEAQSADRVLVSNLGQTAGATADLSTTDVAQRFTTGGNGGGYLLSSLELSFAAGSSAAPTPTVKVVSGSADGVVEATLGAATATVRGNRNVIYTAPAGTLLAAGTDYWVVATQNGTSAPLWRRVTSTGLDATSAAGWGVHTTIEERTQGTTGSFVEAADGRPGRLRVSGSLVDAAPLAVSNLGQPDSSSPSFSIDRAQGFRTGSHPAGYQLGGLVLASKDLLDVANAPTVALYAGGPNGTKVADFTGPSSIPTNGWLEYTPTEPLILLGGTTYWMVATTDAADVSDVSWRLSENLGADADAAPGWSMFETARFRARGASGGFQYSTAEEHELGVNQPGLHKLGVRATPVVHSLGGNIDQIPSGDRSTAAFDLAQEFTTGRNPNGYDLAEVHLPLTVMSAPTVTVHYRSGVKIADLAGPFSYGSDEQAYVFTPAEQVTLTASTTYVVRVEGGDARWTTTASHSEDTGGQPDFTVADKALTRAHDSTGSYSGPAEAHMLRLHGEVNPVDETVLISNNMQDTGSAQTLISATDSSIAQGFATLGRTDDRVAALTSVSLRLRYTGSAESFFSGPTVTLFEGDPTESPDTWVWLRDLETTASLANIGAAGTLVKYSAFAPGTTDIAPVTLKSQTDYFAMAWGGFPGVEIMATTSRNEDPGLSGFLDLEERGATRASISGVAFSAHTHAFRMTVHGFYLPSPPDDQTVPATEAANVFRVRGELHVNLEDFDPLAEHISNDTYKWQRFSADGTSLETDSIGTGAAYRLTDADVGKTIKAVVEYTDLGGYKKGPVTSAASPEIEAAAACAAPTVVGGAVELVASALVVSEFDGNYGFSADSSAYDRLDERDFTASDTNDYNIEALAAYDATTNFLAIGLDKAVTAAEKRELTLYVCDEPYTFSSSTVDNSFDGAVVAYKWEDEDLDWSDVGGLTVRLVQDSVAPSFESAAVDGTSLVVTFSEDLAAAASLANSAFAVMKTPQGGSAETVSLSLAARR